MFHHPPTFPPPANGQAVIHLMNAADCGDPSLHDTLTDEERARAGRFRFESDRLRWMGWRGGMRWILSAYLGLLPSEVPLIEDSTGKPQLPRPHDDWFFNLSHAKDYAALIIARSGPVGVDLEPIDRAHPLSGCLDAFCHPAEIEALPSDPDECETHLIHLWTAKEALLKALGCGLAYPPQQLRIVDGEVAANPAFPILSAMRLIHPESPPGHLLAAALPMSLHDVRISHAGLAVDTASVC